MKETISLLKETNFTDIVIKQTVFSGRTDKIDLAENGYGVGSFIIMKAIKASGIKKI